jgi:hypothetical protein
MRLLYVTQADYAFHFSNSRQFSTQKLPGKNTRDNCWNQRKMKRETTCNILSTCSFVWIVTWLNVTAASILLEEFGVVIAYNNITERHILFYVAIFKNIPRFELGRFGLFQTCGRFV